MATTETKILDDVIASRRAMLLGGTALAALAMTGTAKALAVPTAFTDADILNFALNLEYLEANFYYLAAFGTTIDKPNSASMTAGGPTTGINIDGIATNGQDPKGVPVTLVKANSQVPFGPGGATLGTVIGSYATETAIEEGKHVIFLRNALGGAKVAQPSIDLLNSFNVLASAAGIGSAFDPFADGPSFLIGAYVFEDVGVSAYHGAAPALSLTTTGKGYLQAAAGILAVEAYHAGLVRTTINQLDFVNGNQNLSALTQKVSALRAKLAAAALTTQANPNDPYNPDDFGVRQRTLTINGATVVAGAPATQIVDAPDDTVVAFARNTTQVLNIVTGGGITSTPAKGVFFPNGLNGLFS